MTRFARAKGSKASNEKTPEDSTPWEVMKEQLLQAKKESDEAKNRQEAEKQRIENYENFLKEHKVQKRNSSWCDFPEADKGTKNVASVSNNNEQPPAKKKKNKNKAVNGVQGESTEECYATNKVATKEPNTPLEKKSKKNKNKNKQLDETPSNQSEPQETEVDTLQVAELPAKKKKNKKKKNESASSTQIQTENTNIEAQNGDVENSNSKKNKAKKNKVKKNDTNSADGVISNSNVNPQNNNNKQNNALKKKKNKKLVGGKPERRKEINDCSFQLIINGKEVELVRYDGFPIMKKDAERLAELKSSMIKKGIPKSEVQRTMKLERRRAEKALARVKRDVCYNCRKGGHNLSDCPELKSKIPGVDAAEGVCFKCGSTEHRQFECKVQRDKEFRFATCFICKEPGHIARQCPDNPKGLYPNGGSCKLCGDVTHLRKDCPTANDKKEETSVKLQTLDSTDNIEDIGQQFKTSGIAETSKKPKKIKF